MSEFDFSSWLPEAVFWRNALLALGMVLLSYLLGKLLEKLLRVWFRANFEDHPASVLMAKSVLWAVVVMGVLMAMSHVGINIASILAAVGAAGLAIGLALKDSLSNVAATFLIVANRFFEKGDFIQVDAYEGSVEEIRLLTTTLKTGDNKVLHVPNRMILEAGVTNFSGAEMRRIELVVGVAYDSDLKKVRAVVESILKADDRVLKEPHWQIGLKDFGESALQLVLRPWVRVEDYWEVYFALTENLKERFDEEGVVMPFPQREVRLLSEEGSA